MQTVKFKRWHGTMLNVWKYITSKKPQMMKLTKTSTDEDQNVVNNTKEKEEATND